jgi:hypothetical protein
MATPPFGLSVPGLAIPEHDHISMAYTGANVTSVVYRSGGASGLIVTTLTLAYDGNNNLLTIVKS